MPSRTAPRFSTRTAGLAAVVVALMAHGSALAQEAAAGAPPAAGAAAPAAASTDAMTNLIRLLVAQGTITKANGDALLQQAQGEADAARARMAVVTPPAPPPVPEGGVRVSRVPEAVRAQIRDELRNEIMQQAASEGWVTKGQAAPEWTKRIRLFGDVRVRSENDLYSKKNSNQILDIAAMNAQGPIDLAKAQNYLFINSREDRVNRLRYRVRLGLEADVTKGVTAGVTLASGDDKSPISPNSSLGGGLGKRNIWLDQAWIKVQPTDWAALSFGRFENPFNTTELLFDNDLRFDGVAAKLNFANVLGRNSAVTLTGGAFPLDFGSADYPNAAVNKTGYPSKWLFSGELALKGEVFDDVTVKASVGYHSFRNVQGKLSDECNMDLTNYCSTDGLVPQFLRKGNTVFTMRNHVTNSTGVYPQTFGLKFGYDILDARLGAQFPISDATFVKLNGDYVKNLGFKKSDICSGLFDSAQAYLVEPFNNYGSDGNTDRHVCTKTNPTSFVGGDTGYAGSLVVGSDKVDAKGSWMVGVEYRYLESDAVMDSLTDSDFHLGGTNVKGYILSGEYAVRDGISIGGRWMSANEIAGEPLAIDVLQIDLKARF